MTAADPEHQLIQILKDHQIDFATTLPCDKLRGFLSVVPHHFHEIPLTREADGFGICAGLALAGRRPVMVIQNTGLGNSVTDIASLFQIYELPMPVLMSWRGVYREAMEAQKNLGAKIPGLLESLGIPYTVVESAEELGLVSDAIDDAHRRQTLHVILLLPRVWEESELCTNLGPDRPQGRRGSPTGPEFRYRQELRGAQFTRYEAISSIMEQADDRIVIGNIGVPSKELFALRDRPLNFYMLGSLGLATSIGVGLSIGQQRDVWVLDGDGSLLMNPNALFSLGMFGRSNLTVFAIDNACWGSTGNQATPTLDQLDLGLLARCCGIDNVHKVHSAKELRRALRATGQNSSIFLPIRETPR